MENLANIQNLEVELNQDKALYDSTKKDLRQSESRYQAIKDHLGDLEAQKRTTEKLFEDLVIGNERIQAKTHENVAKEQD